VPLTAALALNLTGHLVGVALYAMLVALVVAPPPGAARPVQGPWWQQSIRLALLTGLLGLVWNLGALTTDLYTLSGAPAPALVLAGAFVALGFLPAVVVYAVVRGDGRPRGYVGGAATIVGVLLAAVVGVRQVVAALRGQPVPDVDGLLWLTGGATVLLVLLLLWTRDQRRGSFWVLGLAIFAVSGFHLTGHSGRETWWVALVGHHASLPLAVAILQQEYRFAFADVFLKRALAVMALATVMLSVWLCADALLSLDRVRLDDPLTFAALLALGLTAAMTYPVLHRATSRVVDRWLLRRAEPMAQQSALIRRLAVAESEDDVLEALRVAIGAALDARRVTVSETDLALMTGRDADPQPRSLHVARTNAADDAAVILLHTVRAPFFSVAIGDLQYGRRVWSDDIALLDTFASAASRRLDALRDERRRLEQATREQEVGRLAVEAELRAVRAQLHPHFLFNALNTIRFLISTAPQRADVVLLQLTGVLRAVLRGSADEFSTLAEEVELVRSYLAIEQARFGSRLVLEIIVPEALGDITLPALVLQPLVENAVRHGIAPLRKGGSVHLTARRADADETITIVVRDTGTGGDPSRFTRDGGVGLASVARRLSLHYGEAASLHLESAPGEGTTVALTIPAPNDTRRSVMPSGSAPARQPAAVGDYAGGPRG